MKYRKGKPPCGISYFEFVFHILAKKEGISEMKKLLSVFCFLLIMMVCSCDNQEIDAFSLVAKVLEIHPELPAGDVIYYEGALPGEKSYMTSHLRSLLYDDGRDRHIPEFDSVLEYAVNLSDGQYGMEIHIFHMESEADARNMEKLLRRRLLLLKRRSLYLYLPSVYEDYFASAVVVTEKKYVFLLATGKNEEILKELKSML